jgi:hypothetical protein
MSLGAVEQAPVPLRLQSPTHIHRYITQVHMLGA